jgi:NTP pyrophosphatase (non-canonical NTP hydrolase)
MTTFNQLQPGTAEVLALMSEEAGEIVQAIGKVLRHGLDSHNPNDGEDGPDNRRALERELGDLLAAIDIAIALHTVDAGMIQAHRRAKLDRVGSYLHHITWRTLQDARLRAGAGDNGPLPQDGEPRAVALRRVRIARPHRDELPGRGAPRAVPRAPARGLDAPQLGRAPDRRLGAARDDRGARGVGVSARAAAARTAGSGGPVA